MFDIFYGGGRNTPNGPLGGSRLNRGAGTGNLVFTCACSNCDMTVQVFASNIREAARKCARRGQNVGCNCTGIAPIQTEIRR
jgi:methylase of polypeptide subunit release factors